MDTAHHLLLSFPIDVLAGITSHIQARDLAHLWNCGDRLLREALGSRGGAKTFRFEHETRLASRWPSLLRHLPHLTDLTIEERKLSLCPRLLEASSVLRKINLSFDKALAGFLQAFAQAPSHFAHLEILTVDSELEPIDGETFKILKTVSSLTALDLSSPNYSGSTQDFVPPNLTSLTLNMDHIGTLDFKLPASLEHFQCWFGDVDSHGDPGDLPPGLRYFCLNVEYINFSASDITKLPRNLTRLTAPMARIDPSALLTALPPRLKYLSSSNGSFSIPNEQLKLLPQTLTWVDLIEPATINSLPIPLPDLAYLQLASNDLNLISKLPPKLTHLRCNSTPIIPCEDGATALSLPTALETLWGCPAELLDHVTLPDCLKTVNVAVSLFTVAHALRLPQKLESLSVYRYDPESLANLPRALQTLYAGHINSPTELTSEAIRHLPPSIVSVFLISSGLQSDDALSLFPSTLTRLTLHLETMDVNTAVKMQLPNLVNLEFMLKRDRAALGDAIVLNLPRKLRSLRYSIREHQIDEISLDSLKALPRGLVTLIIPHSAAIAALDVVPSHCPQHLNIHCGKKWIAPAKLGIEGEV